MILPNWKASTENRNTLTRMKTAEAPEAKTVINKTTFVNLSKNPLFYSFLGYSLWSFNANYFSD